LESMKMKKTNVFEEPSILNESNIQDI
jgi:hypothetical protein